MRAFAFASAISLALAGPAQAAPRRVASLNLCTDELVLMLAAPGQIASVTHLSQSAAESPLWRDARRSARNDGTLLSVVPLKPDLVLTMGGAGRDSARIAQRIGARLVSVPFTASLDDVEVSIRTVAEALGRPAQGRALVARIKALRGSAPALAHDAVWMGGGGRSQSATSLGAQWMALAGLRQRALAADRIGLEELATRPPRYLLRSDYRSAQYSNHQSWLSHPLARVTARSKQLVADGRRWTCLGPSMIGEIEQLRRLVR